MSTLTAEVAEKVRELTQAYGIAFNGGIEMAPPALLALAKVAAEKDVSLEQILKNAKSALELSDRVTKSAQFHKAYGSGKFISVPFKQWLLVRLTNALLVRAVCLEALSLEGDGITRVVETNGNTTIHEFVIAVPPFKVGDQFSETITKDGKSIVNYGHQLYEEA